MQYLRRDKKDEESGNFSLCFTCFDALIMQQTTWMIFPSESKRLENFGLSKKEQSTYNKVPSQTWIDEAYCKKKSNAHHHLQGSLQSMTTDCSNCSHMTRFHFSQC